MSINRLRTGLALLLPRLMAVSLLLLLLVSLLGSLSKVSAFDYPKLNNRSLHLEDVSPGATTTYTISFRYPAPTTIGSVKFVLCSDPYVLDPCSSTPNGDMSSANLNNQSGVTGFSILSQAANEIILTRPSAGASTVQSTYEFNNVVNPTTVQSKIYIQIFTYSSTDASGTPNHISSVANAITEPIVINSEVPQILYFCAALTVTDWCASANGSFIDYGDLSSDDGHYATSQFGAATNAVGGYSVTVNGKTMTAGEKSIEALDLPAAFATGVPQFGLNIRANMLPPVGQDVTGTGIGVVTTDYNTPDMFKFTDGDEVANAATGTLFNTYTVTYIVNVPPDQPAGVYNTTVAYICTADF